MSSDFIDIKFLLEKEGYLMSKVILIIVGAIIAILGILTLFPMMWGLWLSIVLIGIGIISIILGFLSKRKKV
jgi:hypothetical protein